MKSGLTRINCVSLAAAAATVVGGCANQGYSVIASTATTIGVSLAAQPATGAPDATLGYKRAELAFVPTNRNGGADAGKNNTGAKDSANVLMELRYTGIFDRTANSGIYQRLAVGDTAVQQAGASVMFAKGPDGKLDAEGARALEAVKGAKHVSVGAQAARRPLDAAYLKAQSAKDDAALKSFNSAANSQDCGGYTSYSAFAGDAFASEPSVSCVRQKLTALGVKLEDGK